MTHARQMSEHEGKFDKAFTTDLDCPKCGEHTVTVRTWESNDGAYEDEKYQCDSCGHSWWVEGIDS